LQIITPNSHIEDSELVSTLLLMAILHEPAAIALAPRDRLEFMLVGEGGVLYITPKAVGVAAGKSTLSTPLAAELLAVSTLPVAPTSRVTISVLLEVNNLPVIQL